MYNVGHMISYDIDYYLNEYRCQSLDAHWWHQQIAHTAHLSTVAGQMLREMHLVSIPLLFIHAGLITLLNAEKYYMKLSCG